MTIYQITKNGYGIVVFNAAAAKDELSEPHYKIDIFFR